MQIRLRMFPKEILNAGILNVVAVLLPIPVKTVTRRTYLILFWKPVAFILLTLKQIGTIFRCSKTINVRIFHEYIFPFLLHL